MGPLVVIAYLIEMYIRPQDWMSAFYALPLVDIIAGMGLFIVLFSLLQRNKPIKLPQIYFVLLFLCVVFLSNATNGDMTAGYEQFVLYAKRTAIFFMMIFLIKTTRQVKAAAGVIIFLTVILAIQSLYQSNTGIGLAGQSLVAPNSLGGGRASWVGAWDGPNVLCLLFVIAIGLALGFIGRPFNIFVRLMNIVFICVMIAGIYVTNSRGGYLGLLSVVFTFMWLRFIGGKKIVIKAVVILISIAVLFIGLKLGPARMAQLNTEEKSAHERTWLWERSVNLLREKPVFGIGKGKFSVEGYTAAHSNFVQNMAEMGFAGLFIYTTLIYLSLKGLYIVRKYCVANNIKTALFSMTNAVFISMVGYAVTTFFVTMELDILFAWFGLCAAVVNICRIETNANIRLKFSLVDAGMVFSWILGLMFIIYLVAFKEII